MFSLVRTSSYKFLISAAEFRLEPVLTGEMKLLMRVAVPLLSPSRRAILCLSRLEGVRVQVVAGEQLIEVGAVALGESGGLADVAHRDLQNL